MNDEVKPKQLLVDSRPSFDVYNKRLSNLGITTQTVSFIYSESVRQIFDMLNISIMSLQPGATIPNYSRYPLDEDVLNRLKKDLKIIFMDIIPIIISQLFQLGLINDGALVDYIITDIHPGQFLVLRHIYR
jgi:hypothetical protein